MVNICEECERPAELKCASCKSVFYCSKTHQKHNWPKHKPKCQVFQVSHSERVGRCLVAVRDITAGNAVLQERPLLVGPRWWDPSAVCLGCLAPAPATVCPRCAAPACRPDCSALLDTVAHAAECRLLALNPNKFRYEIITPLRFLLLQKLAPSKWAKLIAMEAHMDSRGPGTPIYREIDEEIATPLLDNYLGLLDEEVFEHASRDVIHRICAILDTNGVDVEIKRVQLSALYANFCMLEHDCSPNTRHDFAADDFKLTLYATLDIPKGGHISTMYANAAWGTHARRAYLKESKNFDCACKRCADPTEFETYFSALKCLGVPSLANSTQVEVACDGWQLPIDPLDEKSDWKCSRCPATVDSDTVASLISQLQMQVEPTTQRKPSVAEMKALIKRLEQVLHPNHYLCFSAKHTLVQLYGDKECPMTKLSTEDLGEKLDLCISLTRTIRTLDPGESRLNLYLTVLLFEQHRAIVEKARRKVAASAKDSIRPAFDSVEQDLSDARALLRQNLDILKKEHNYAYCGEFVVKCRQSISDLDKIIRTKTF